MTNLNFEELIELYKQVCGEAGLEWTPEGWQFFDKVMIPDYLNHCKRTNTTPNKESFKRNCVLLALEMIEEAKAKAV